MWTVVNKALVDAEESGREASGEQRMEGCEVGAVVEEREVGVVVERGEVGVIKRVEGGERWETVQDVGAWVHCPIGVCPQQRVGANMLDIPDGNGDGQLCQGQMVLFITRRDNCLFCHTPTHSSHRCWDDS
jgi:hypothetical protein